MAFPWMAAGPILSGLTSAFSALRGERGMSQADAMAGQLSTAQDMRRWELENGPSLEMSGLRRAGINPMLRYGSGGSGVPMGGFTPTVAQPNNPMQGFANAIGGIGESVSSAYKAFTSGQRDEAETTRTEMEMALRIPAEIAQIQANTLLTVQQRENAVAEQARILQDTLLKTAQEELARAQAEAVPAQIAVAMANVRLLGQQWSTEFERSIMTAWQSIAARQATAQGQAAEDFYRSAFGRLTEWLRLSRRALPFGG